MVSSPEAGYEDTEFENQFKEVPTEFLEKILRIAAKEKAWMDGTEGTREPKQIREIIPVRKWLNSFHHLGPAARDIYPFWKEEIADFFEGGYNEFCIGGGQGIGRAMPLT